MNIVWRFFTVASLPVCVLYCLLYCSGPAVSGCAATSLSVVVMDGENPLPGRPGCPGFCSLCLSYRNRPSEPLALFLKKKPAARPRPVHGGHGCAGIPSAASLFGWYTGPLRRPKKGPSLAATPPATVRPLKPIARRAGLLQRLCPGRRMLPCRSPAPRAIWFRCHPTTQSRGSRRNHPSNPPF